MEDLETNDSKPVLPLPHERLLAVLAHLSAFVAWFGWLIALTIWFANRGEARYAAYQAKQACVFQIVMGFVCVVSWFSSAKLFAYRWGPIGAYGIISATIENYYLFLPFFILLIFTLTYGLVGAIYCAWGLPFRYRFISLWLRPE